MRFRLVSLRDLFCGLLFIAIGLLIGSGVQSRSIGVPADLGKDLHFAIVLALLLLAMGLPIVGSALRIDPDGDREAGPPPQLLALATSSLLLLAIGTHSYSLAVGTLSAAAVTAYWIPQSGKTIARYVSVLLFLVCAGSYSLPPALPFPLTSF